MKIRNGFVSNSSSSSFIVTTTVSKEYLYKIIQRLSTYDCFLENLEKDKDYWTKQYKESNELCLSYDIYKHESEKLNLMFDKAKEAIAANNRYMLVDIFLAYRHIDLEEIGTVLKLSSWTSMFNDFSSVADELKEILCHLMAEKHHVQFEQVSDY